MASEASQTWPTTYRGLTRLAKKHGIKITPNALTMRCREEKMACLFTFLGFVNSGKDDIMWYSWGQANCPDSLSEKFEEIERGLENWPFASNNSMRRYYKIGQRLREHVFGNSQN